jgi:hypothetical protein
MITNPLAQSGAKVNIKRPSINQIQMSERRQRQRTNSARFQARKQQRKLELELENRINTLNFYNSGSAQDNSDILLQENANLRRLCGLLESDNMKLRIAPESPPPEFDYPTIPQVSMLLPAPNDTLSIPVSVPVIQTPETSLANDIFEILLIYQT